MNPFDAEAVRVFSTIDPSPWFIGLLTLLICLAAYLTQGRLSQLPRGLLYIIPHVVCGILVMASGVPLQWLLWTVFSYGLPAGQRQIEGMLGITGSLSFLLKSGLGYALVPGSMTGLVAALYRSRAHKVIAAICAAIFWLNVADLVQFALGTQIFTSAKWAPAPQSWVRVSFSGEAILFSVLSNLIGGAAAGSVVGYVSSFFTDTQATAPPRMIQPTRPLFILILLGLCTLPLVIYFGFFYPLPTPVRLSIQDWSELRLRFLGPSVPYSGVVEAPIAINANTVVSGSLPGDLPLRYVSAGSTSSTSRSPTATMTIAALTSSSGRDLMHSLLTGGTDALLQAGRIDYRGVVPQGNIMLHGVELLAVWAGSREEGTRGQGQVFTLALPWRQYIEISRAREDFMRIVPEAVKQGLAVMREKPEVSTVVLRGLRLAEVTSPARRRIAVLIDTGGWSGRSLRISLANGEWITVEMSTGGYARRGNGGGNSGTASAALLVFDSGSEQGQLVVGGGGFLACSSCAASFRAMGVLSYRVGDVDLRSSVGSLEVSLNEYTLKREGELYLGGEELTFRPIRDLEFALNGYARPVLLNDVALSRSLWSSTTIVEKLLLLAVGGVGSMLCGALSRRWIRRWK